MGGPVKMQGDTPRYIPAIALSGPTEIALAALKTPFGSKIRVLNDKLGSASAFKLS